MTIVSLFGRPGAGKSTVGRLLAERHGFLRLPLGDILKNSATLAVIGIDPDEMRAAIESGRTVTSEKLYPWLDRRIGEALSVVVDGYPRATNSLAPYDALVGSLPAARRAFALYLDCPMAVTHPRLAARGRSDDDGRIARRDLEKRPFAARVRLSSFGRSLSQWTRPSSLPILPGGYRQRV